MLPSQPATRKNHHLNKVVGGTVYRQLMALERSPMQDDSS
jgi:hypothetical protein